MVIIIKWSIFYHIPIVSRTTYLESVLDIIFDKALLKHQSLEAWWLKLKKKSLVSVSQTQIWNLLLNYFLQKTQINLNKTI